MGKPGAIGFETPGEKSACHVPTIIDWVHAERFCVGWADADDIPNKISAAGPTVRIDGM